MLAQGKNYASVILSEADPERSQRGGQVEGPRVPSHLPHRAGYVKSPYRFIGDLPLHRNGCNIPNEREGLFTFVEWGA